MHGQPGVQNPPNRKAEQFRQMMDIPKTTCVWGHGLAAEPYPASSYSDVLGGEPGAEAQEHRAGGDVEGAADLAAHQ